MKQDLLKALAELSEAQEQEEERYDKEAEQWWNSLSKEQQMRAFYCVVKRLVEGELVEHGSYRYVLYETFGFGPEAYGLGVHCGYMALHNSIDREVKQFT